MKTRLANFITVTTLTLLVISFFFYIPAKAKDTNSARITETELTETSRNKPNYLNRKTLVLLVISAAIGNFLTKAGDKFKESDREE